MEETQLLGRRMREEQRKNKKGAAVSPLASQRFLYWLFTIMFTLPMGASGVAYLLQAPPIVEAISHLGYPLYLLKILGTFKILGVAAIWYNRNKFLKEWAYAGFTFNLIGALSSHAFAGDPSYKIAIPLVLLMVVAISYKVWKNLENPKTSRV